MEKNNISGSSQNSDFAADKVVKTHLLTPLVADPRDSVIPASDYDNKEVFSLHAVFQVGAPLPENPEQREMLLSEILEKLSETPVEIRGWYDLSAYRSDADLLFWGLAEQADQLQSAYHLIANSHLGAYLVPVFSVMSTYLPMEFNKHHLPACISGKAPRNYLSLYTFSRALDWYSRDRDERQQLLAEHSIHAKDYLDVQVSTLCSMGISDLEWAVSMEHDQLQRIIKMLRRERECADRNHVSKEGPCYTGKRLELSEWIELQPFDNVLK